MTVDDINNLINLIKEYIDQQPPEEIKETLKYIKNTKDAVRARQQGEQAAKYNLIKISIL